MDSEFINQLKSGSAIEFCHWLHAQMYENHCDIPQLKKLLQEGQGDFRGLLAVSIFLKEVSDPSLTDLHQKCLNSIIQLYIELGIDIDELVETRWNYTIGNCQCVEYTPLHQSIRDNKITIAKALVHLGADVNKASSTGFTPLHYAIRNSRTELVTFLIDQDANIHPEKEPLLHFAIFYDQMDILKLLIQRGLNINSKRCFLRSSDEYLCDCKCNPKSYMQDNSINFTITMSVLSFAILRDRVDSIQWFFDQNNLVVDLDDLHWSLVKGHSNLAPAILDKFTLANKQSLLADDKIKGKYYALHCLCESALSSKDKSEQTKKLISMYINHGWDINSVSEFPKDQWFRNTLLSGAVKQNNNDFVSFLLSFKADPNIPIYSGELSHNRKEHRCLFRDLYSSVDWKVTVLTATAFHTAIMYGNSETLSILLNNGANLDLPFGSSTCDISIGFSPDKFPVFNRSLTCFEILLTQQMTATSGIEWTRELQWLTNYLQSGKQLLDKNHLTLSILGGNIFVISQILRFLPKNISLEKYTIFENEIPALQILMSWINWPTSGNQEDSNFNAFWRCLTEIIHQFIQRGYSLNDFKSCAFANLPMGCIAIRLALTNQYQVLLDYFFETGEVNWNAKFNFGRPVNEQTPMEYAMRYEHLKELTKKRSCFWKHWNADQSVSDQKCIPEVYVKTLKDLLDKGALVNNDQLLWDNFYIHPCLLQESNLIKKLRWAGANFQGTIDKLDLLERKHHEGDFSLKPGQLQLISDWKEWIEKERRKSPRLTHLAALAVRRTFTPDYIERKKLNNLIYEYTSQRYGEE